MTSTTDSHLIARARSGDRDAFGELIARHLPMVNRLASALLPDGDVAAELAQESLLQAYLSLDGLRDPARFKSWLYGLTLNVCRNYLRERRMRFVPLDDLEGGTRFDALPFAPRSPDPAEVAEERDLHRRVLAAVESLSEANRAAVLLHYYDGLTLAEIAGLLGLSVVAVKGRLHKSRQHLRESLRALAPEMPVYRRTDMLTVSVADVVQNEEDQFVIVLLDAVSRQALPIWVGPFEGRSIAWLHAGETTLRPMTFAFIARLLDAADVALEEVRIEALREEVFYGIARIRSGPTVQEVDCRPSDAIALALQMGCPIRVAEAVMQAGGLAVPDEYDLGAVPHKGVDQIVTQLKAVFGPPLCREPQSEEDQLASRRRLLDHVFG